MRLRQNLFWPIYKQIEKEFKELSYFITIDRKQLKTYSIKIADLILRTVSECENIAKELCKKEKIKFKDKKGRTKQFIIFAEYIDELDKRYNLKGKLVSFDFDNVVENAFDCKHQPFHKKTVIINKQERQVWSWYHAYNNIKHDRVKNFKEANLENLIDGLAALFLLNVYYKNQVFYSVEDCNLEVITEKIEGFSDVFTVDYTIMSDFISQCDKLGDSFFNPAKFVEISLPYSTYIIEFEKEFKTDFDKGAETLDKLESMIYIQRPDGTLVKKHDHYETRDHKTICAIVADLNKAF